MTKKILSVLLALCLVIGAVPLAALADEPVQASEFSLAGEAGPLDNDELFAGYVDRLFFGNADISTYADSGHNAGSRLTGDSRKLYDGLKAGIIEIAKGNRASTTITVSGVALPRNDGQAKSMITTVVNALLSDCPYELFWFDKVRGWSAERSTVSTSVKLYVDKAYSKTKYTGTFETDAAKIKSVQTAATNAIKVVNDNKGKSDYQKLVAYKEFICNAVIYNKDAANKGWSIVGADPWQLIYVFDNNSSTNVVCEGYSKAFQYLCDLTEFENDTIQCYSVLGEVSVEYSDNEIDGGPHMWNIVTIDGKNYLVDVTNCDLDLPDPDTDGKIIPFGSTNSLFLVGCTSGNVTNGYVITTGRFVIPGTQTCIPEAQYTYKYDTNQSGLFGDVLKLSNENYDPSDLVIDSEGVLTKYKGSGGAVEIPETVTSIGEGAFSGCTGLTSIGIPNGVTSIGNDAFYKCTSLTSIEIPSGVTSIGDRAFSGCTGLTSIVIPGGVTSIGDHAFSGCTGLTSIAVPASVTSIGEDAFVNCAKLAGINVDESNSAYSSNDGILFNKGKTQLISCPAGKQGACTIPEGVTSIGNNAFRACIGLTGIEIPDNVTRIGKEAFLECSALTDVYYSGTEAKWKAITVDSGNDCLTQATIHYNGVVSVTLTATASPASVVIPAKGAEADATLALTAAAFDKGGESVEVKGDAAWSVSPATAGISIPAKAGATNTLTVKPGIEAPAGGKVTVTVSYSGSTASTEIAITRAAPEVTSVKIIKGNSSVTLPENGKTAKQTYTAQVSDQYGVVMPGASVTWSLGDEYAGVTLKDGVITVSSEASPGEIVLKAACGSVSSDDFKITLTNAPWKSPYKDVTTSDWFYESGAIEYVTKTGLMKGMPGAKFSPQTPLTRAQFAQILYNKAGKPKLPVTSKSKFSDVKAGDWFGPAVIWAAENGVVNGVGGGKFSPNQMLTREQLATMIWRFEGKPKADASVQNKFPDAGNVSGYAKSAMAYAVKEKIIKGSGGKLNPQKSATRAETAQVLQNWLDK